MDITFLTEAELRQCVTLDMESLAAVEEGFQKLSDGQAMMPPIMRIVVPENNGEVDIKSAYIKGLDSFAVKMSSGFFDNHKLGLPSLGGMMILLSAKVGFPEALLLDNGYLTDVRTGLAGGIAAKYLAPKTVKTVGVVGAGMQARMQVQAIQLVREFEQVLVYNRTPDRADDYVKEMTSVLGVNVKRADLAEVVSRSDVVITTTPANDPFLKADWLHAGMHITAMGSDGEEKNELYPEVLKQADLLVCDSRSQVFRLGEHHHALEAGAIAEDHPSIEIGGIIGGEHPGRTSPEQITVADLTGTGVQDTAIALLAYQKAQEAGLGTRIEA